MIESGCHLGTSQQRLQIVIFLLSGRHPSKQQGSSHPQLRLTRSDIFSIQEFGPNMSSVVPKRTCWDPLIVQISWAAAAPWAEIEDVQSPVQRMVEV